MGEASVLRTYRFRLMPRKAQHRSLVAALDHTRDLFNAALEERASYYRVTGKSMSYMSQTRSLTVLRKDTAYSEFPTALQYWPLRKVDQAFAAFFRRIKAGEKPGYPRYRSKSRFDTFGFAHGPSNGWQIFGSRLYMKGVGRVRMNLHRSLPSKPISCLVKRDSGGWTVSLVCEIPVSALPTTGAAVGIDLGITAFLATSGDIVPGCHAARRAQAETRRRQRALARCKRGSNNRRKAKSLLRNSLAKVGRTRATFAHQVAARLIRENDLIAIEKLNIGGLARSILSRDVHDAAWGKFTVVLIEKAEKAARTVVKVDPRYTSQACSGCGVIVPKGLKVRTHDCPDCGLILDRDVNAARNVLHRAISRPDALNVGSH